MTVVGGISIIRASDKCQKEKRKTINGDDLLWAMATLGFEDYIDPLKAYLARYREVISFICVFDLILLRLMFDLRKLGNLFGTTVLVFGFATKEDQIEKKREDFITQDRLIYCGSFWCNK